MESQNILSKHSFHIPVMGIGFTIDTPLKVAPYGIDAVISLVDDLLLEKLREKYAMENELPYAEISEKEDDFRAKRITAYLNLIHQLATQKYEELKASGKKIARMGSIDVNIMTKVDKDNFINKKKLPVEYNDAHAALRGYANSNLCSSVVLSAGMNPRLYSYLENFDDFFPNEEGVIKKKVILKVSDFRSASIQGRFLAKKGIWVSEYRIESGLNCGGHAFATDGNLMGPVLQEFKENKIALAESTFTVLVQALEASGRAIPQALLSIKVTAQGGVGTHKEHQYLLDHYEVDSVGWGTPFLLVPEATTVDKETRDQLVQAKEKDLYLSGISPLGVPFNTLRGNTKEVEKQMWIAKGRPGSPCPKKYVTLNKEYGDEGLCTASRHFQYLKIKELDEKETTSAEYQSEYNKIVEKSCICVGLGTSALLAHGIGTRVEGDGVSICPGPNMAYFSRIISLEEMVAHIYGQANIIEREDRPQMFIKEMGLYFDYLKKRIRETKAPANRKEIKYLSSFASNLENGILYYQDLFVQSGKQFLDEDSDILIKLASYMQELYFLKQEIERLSLPQSKNHLSSKAS